MNADVEKEDGVGSSKMCDSGVERTGACVGWEVIVECRFVTLSRSAAVSGLRERIREIV